MLPAEDQVKRDFVDSLRCVPMAVRRKLDLAGVKIVMLTSFADDVAEPVGTE